MSEEIKEEEEKVEEVKAAAVVTNEADEKHRKVQMGTKETKEVLRFLFAIIKTVKAAKDDDGMINGSDIMHLTKLYPYIGPAFEDVNKVISELKDLDEAEIRDLIVFTGADLGNVVEGKALEILEVSVEAAVALVKLIALIAKKK